MTTIARTVAQSVALQPDRRLAALHYLREQGQATRRAIADQLGMSASMVSRLISDLLAQGLIYEQGRAESGGGRPSDLLALSPEAGYVVGLEIGSARQIAVLVNLRGEIVSTLSAPTQLATERSVILANIEHLIEQLLKTAGTEQARLLGVGVGLHALVDPVTGTVYGWANTPVWSELWTDFALRDALADTLPHTYIAIEDTVRTLGIAEATYGQGGSEDFVFVQVDTGIGMAIVIDGKPYIGPSRITGELGHIAVDPASHACVCGNNGCLETVASTTAVVQRAEQLLHTLQVRSTLRHHVGPLTIQDVIAAGEQGDQLAYRLLTEAGEYLGSGLAIVLNLLGPRRVVVGGTLADSSVYLDAARRVMRLRALHRALPHDMLERSSLDARAGAWGAATLALNALFSSAGAHLLLDVALPSMPV